MNYNATGIIGLDAYTITSGTKVPFVWDATNPGCTLTATTFYIPFGSERSAVPTEVADLGLQLKWAAAVAGTATIEVCNYPATLSGSGQGAAFVTDYDQNHWSLLDPTLSGMTYAVASGASNSVTKFTVTLGGAAAGLAAWNMPAFGWRRGRIKLALTVGGIVLANISGKLAA